MVKYVELRNGLARRLLEADGCGPLPREIEVPLNAEAAAADHLCALALYPSRARRVFRFMHERDGVAVYRVRETVGDFYAYTPGDQSGGNVAQLHALKPGDFLDYALACGCTFSRPYVHDAADPIIDWQRTPFRVLQVRVTQVLAPPRVIGLLNLDDEAANEIVRHVRRVQLREAWGHAPEKKKKPWAGKPRPLVEVLAEASLLDMP